VEQSHDFAMQAPPGLGKLVSSQCHLEALGSFAQNRVDTPREGSVSRPGAERVKQILLCSSVVQRIEARPLHHSCAHQLEPPLVERDQTTTLGNRGAPAANLHTIPINVGRGCIVRPNLEHDRASLNS
jgi:hypothetical protein